MSELRVERLSPSDSALALAKRHGATSALALAIGLGTVVQAISSGRAAALPIMVGTGLVIAAAFVGWVRARQARGVERWVTPTRRLLFVGIDRDSVEPCLIGVFDDDESGLGWIDLDPPADRALNPASFVEVTTTSKGGIVGAQVKGPHGVMVIRWPRGRLPAS